MIFLLACQQPDKDSSVRNEKDTSLREDTEDTVDTDSEDSQENIADLDPSNLPQANSPCKEAQIVRVNRVVDGDTFYAQMGTREEKIRVIGINTPEIGYDGIPSECFANEAQQYVESLIKGKQIWLTFDVTCQDSYGRWLAYAHLGLEEEDFLQRHLIRSGYGYAFPFDDTPTFNSDFVADEQIAKQNQAGGWASCGW